MGIEDVLQRHSSQGSKRTRKTTHEFEPGAERSWKCNAFCLPKSQPQTCHPLHTVFIALMRAHLCSNHSLNWLPVLHSCLLLSVWWFLCMFQLVCRVWPLGRQRTRFTASRRWWMVMGPRRTGPGSCRGMNSYWWEWKGSWIQCW